MRTPSVAFTPGVEATSCEIVSKPIFISQIKILNFHGLGPPPPGLAPGEKDCWIDQGFFGEILDFVRERPDVRITLDDSNVSDWEIACPALKAHGLTATFFIVADRLGRKGYLSGNQVLDMAAAGMAIGSHGMHHRRWVGLSASQLDEEIGSAKKVLEKIVGGEVDAAACPFGAYDRRVLRTLRTAGFRRIYTSDGAPAIPEALIQPRHTIRRGHTLEDVQRVVSTKPAGWFRIWTALKLGIKRWR